MATYENLGMINKPNNSGYKSGKVLSTVNAVLDDTIYNGETKAAGDFLLLTDGISIDSRVHRVVSFVGDTTGSTDNNIVLVKEIQTLDGEVAYEKVLDLVSGLDLSTAATAVSDLMETTTLDRTKSIRELLEDASQELPSRVLLAIECVVVAGTIDMNSDVVLEGATTY